MESGNTDASGARPASNDLAHRLFVIEIPRAIPTVGRRVGLEMVDTPGQGHRGAIAGNRFERGVERAAGLIPAAGTISSQTLGITGTPQPVMLRPHLPAPHAHV